MVAMLIAGYSINLLTIMSISAIATNGTVRGGGAYYMISRTLGPEFGAAIGIVFYLGLVFSTSLNAVGLIDCLVDNFGHRTGSMAQWLPQSYWWQFLWATTVLSFCTLICLAGSGLFARCSNGLLIILLIAIISIPVSAAIRDPFIDIGEGIVFTGFSLDTLRENAMPHFTKGAAGSVNKHRESYQDLFGVLFPATGGILAYVVPILYFLDTDFDSVEPACLEI
jgi:potassium/chloride transporter 9